MSLFKKSLRAKFTLVLFLVGLVPLAGTSLFFYYTAKDALFKNVFKELKWNLESVSGEIESHFINAAKELLIASHNTAFTMYFLEPWKKEYWVAEQGKTLKHLRSIYPDMLDEACYIRSDGSEVARIVHDRLSPQNELSSEEERNEFFHKAFQLNEGEVFQGRPAISEDTKRWVLPNATPIAVKGEKTAILHFEIAMNYYQRLLKKLINPDRGHGFIISSDGEFVAHTQMNSSEKGPLPKAFTENTPPALVKVYRKMMEGESGIEQFSNEGKDYYVVYKPVNTSYIKGRNDNVWSLGYVLPGEKVYVELDIIRYNAIAVGLMASIVIIVAYLLGNYFTKPITELAGATNRLAAGEMPRITLKRDDEIGQLSSSFNIMVEAVKRRDEALKALATTDGLTGLFNYRYFKEAVEKEVKKSQRFGHIFSILIADVDHFKLYNDTYGHPQGDMALKQVAQVFMRATREVDTAARYGGEEFVVIMPETGPDNAVTTAERIRKKVEEELVSDEATQPGGKMTISIGVASYPEDGRDSQALVEAADRALYNAKAMGRNRVCSSREAG